MKNIHFKIDKQATISADIKRKLVAKHYKKLINEKQHVCKCGIIWKIKYKKERLEKEKNVKKSIKK